MRTIDCPWFQNIAFPQMSQHSHSLYSMERLAWADVVAKERGVHFDITSNIPTKEKVELVVYNGTLDDVVW